MRKFLKSVGLGLALGVGPAMPAYAATITVNSGGSIKSAVDQAGPGDVILVKDGTYKELLKLMKSGTADKWITLKAENRHKAKIEGGGYTTVEITGNYWVVDGFEITAKDGHGIESKSNHHNRLINNYVHHCGGSGIQGNYNDYMFIENNILAYNAFTNGWQTSGISIYQAREQTSSGSGHGMIVRNNIAYGNFTKVGSTTTDGNGIIIDDFHNGQGGGIKKTYPRTTLVENNLVFNNGGKGIQVFVSDHVTVRNNTSYHNNLDNKITGTWRGEINNQQGNDNKYYNNIAVADPSANKNNTAYMCGAYGSGTNAGTIWRGNLSFNGTPGNASVAIELNSKSKIDPSENLLGVDPRFVKASRDEKVANFRLQASSPAVDKGDNANAPKEDLDGKGRPSGAKVDLGAYEYGGTPTMVRDRLGDIWNEQARVVSGREAVIFTNPNGAAHVTLFDMTGMRITEIPLTPYDGKIHWDRTDMAGRSVRSGIYLFTMDRRDGALLSKGLFEIR